jgi:hypothetical protein
MTMPTGEAHAPRLLRREVEFTLPLGYEDASGVLHRQGVMRLATAADEVLPLEDPRVVANPAYVGILLLARVVVRLGSIEHLTPSVVEGLFSADFAYLQDLYVRFNEPSAALADTRCPECGTRFTVDVSGVG